MLFAIVTLLAFSGLGLGSPTLGKLSSHYTVKDSLDPPPRWTRVAAATPDHVLKLHIGLKPGNFKELERHLYEGMFAVSFAHLLDSLPHV
jgi:tripeptidyl-peptidase I